MAGTDETLGAIHALIASARSHDKEVFREQRTDFLKRFGAVSPLIQPLVDSLETQPDEEKTPQFIGELLGIDSPVVIANTGEGLLGVGVGITMAGGTDSVAVGGDIKGNLEQHTHHHHETGGEPVDPGEALGRYLDFVESECRTIPLRGIAMQASDSRKDFRPDLAQVYIRLETTTPIRLEKQENRRQTALEALIGVSGSRRHSRLVLLGQPGAGKSTFLNHLCLAMSRRDWNSLPNWPGDECNAIPVRVNLRELASELVGEHDEIEASFLTNWLARWLERKDLHGAMVPIRDALENGNALIALDGLDEIAEKTKREAAARLAERVVERYPKCRLILTCRIHSYSLGGDGEKPDPWVLRGNQWRTAELAEFSGLQIADFVRAWFCELQGTGYLADPDRLINSLMKAIRERPDLRRLAAEPLMLTMMAAGHAHASGRLPRGRAPLYERLVKLLLWEWDDSQDRGCRLAVLFNDKGFDLESELMRVLARVAFRVTENGGTADAPGDFSAELIRRMLRVMLDDDEHWAVDVVGAMGARAGLLREESDGVFRVPHRSFQEYLAGRDLANGEAFVSRTEKLLKDDLALWRNVVLLACGYIGHGSGKAPEGPVWLLDAICPKRAKRNLNGRRLERFAGELLIEIGRERARTVTAARDHNLVERILDRLVRQSTSTVIPASERVETGTILGRLGDARPGVGLRKDGIPWIEWCPIPSGDFFFGDSSEKRMIKNPFKIAKYPITVSQFQAFCDDGGYLEQKWWGAGGFGDCECPEDYDLVFQTPNHPRVGVSWFEAMGFCAWITDKLCDPETEQITLPNEEQWERAARHTDGRVFPWGDGNEKIEDRCNMYLTGIGHTSPVGCFPKGNAESGACDMVGNVLEWCSNHWSGTLPAKTLRGGRFGGNLGEVRCNKRFSLRQSYRYLDFHGFRPVLTLASGT